MKAITLHQPWASLVAEGVKTIETRSWSTKYRGPLAIHASKKRPYDLRGPAPVVGDYAVDWGLHADLGGFNNGGFDEGCGFVMYRNHRQAFDYSDYFALPLGCVVATCTLVDVVPIRGADELLTVSWERHVAPTRYHDELWLWNGPSTTEAACTGRPTWLHDVIEDQRPYGDFAPGRYAWLLDDVQKIEPVAARGRQQLWEWAA